jgi:hypothetical protein
MLEIDLEKEESISMGTIIINLANGPSSSDWALSVARHEYHS